MQEVLWLGAEMAGGGIKGCYRNGKLLAESWALERVSERGHESSR